MYEKFIIQLEYLLKRFKETGDISHMLKIERLVSNYLDSSVLDYLEE